MQYFNLWDHTWSVLLFISLMFQYLFDIAISAGMSTPPLFKDKRTLFFWIIPWVFAFLFVRGVVRYFVKLPWKYTPKRVER